MDSPTNPQSSAPPLPHEQLSLPVGDDVGIGDIPFAQLGHADRASRAKPLVVTVIGIVGVVFSVVGGLICLWSLIMSLAVTMISAIPAAAFSMPTTPGAMTLTNQVTVANTLGTIHPLNAQQQQSLSVFLSQQGENAFPSSGRALSPAAIRLAVVKTSIDPNPPMPPGSARAVLFTLTGGTLRVADDATDYSVASPAIAPNTAVAVNGNATTSPASDPNIAAPAWATDATSNIAQSLVADTQAKIAPRTLNSAQLQTLTNAFAPAAPGQPPLAPDTQITSATMTFTGDLIVVWSSPGATNSVVIDPSGHTAGPNTGSNPLAAITQKNSPGTVRNAVLAAIANLLLMGYLFIIAIMALAGSRKVRRPHLVYATLQVPLAILAAIAGVNLLNVFNRATAGAPQAATIMFAAVITALVCAYPLSLFFLMNTRGVRQFTSAK